MRRPWVRHEAGALVHRKAAVAAGNACQVHECSDAHLIVAHHFWISLVQRGAVSIRQVHIRLAWRRYRVAVTHLKSLENVIAVLLLVQPYPTRSLARYVISDRIFTPAPSDSAPPCSPIAMSTLPSRSGRSPCVVHPGMFYTSHDRCMRQARHPRAQ